MRGTFAECDIKYISKLDHWSSYNVFSGVMKSLSLLVICNSTLSTVNSAHNSSRM